jgi:transcription antitermination factor NusG
MNVEETTLNRQNVNQLPVATETTLKPVRKIKRRKEVPVYVVVERILNLVPKDDVPRSNVVVGKIVNADYRAVKKAFQVIEMIIKYPYPIEIIHAQRGSLAIRISDKKKTDTQDMAKQLLIKAAQLIEQMDKR